MQAPLPVAPRFDGSAYLAWRDDERLTDQLHRVWRVMSDGSWHTLPELAEKTGAGEASASAQLRHLRKERFGAHTVLRRYVENGLHEYQLIENPDAARIIANYKRSKVAS